MKAKKELAADEEEFDEEKVQKNPEDEAFE